MGRERKFITSDTDEGRFEDIERTLQRMSSKLMGMTTVIMPPIPISVAMAKIPEDGEIFRGMFRVSGHISEIFAICEGVAKDSNPMLQITIRHTDNVEASMSVPLKKGVAKSSVEFPVPAASRLLMTVTSPESVSGLWMSALYDMDIVDAAKEALAIDNLVEKIESVVTDAKATEG